MNKEELFKRLSYYFIAIFFYLSYIFPIQSKKILLIMTHDDSDDGNVGAAYNYFHEKNPDLVFKKVTRENYSFTRDTNLFKNLFFMFLVVPYHIATSKFIFMDNVFLPFSAIKLKKETKLVQLWHGTGSIKKFGLDYEEGWIKKMAQKVGSQTSHYIVGSQWMKEIYTTAFKATDNQIYNIGCPRTDLFFQEYIMQRRKEQFYRIFPELTDKKLILYAPTFRDEESADEIEIHMNIGKLLANVDDNYVLGLRLHPHIADKVDLDEICSKGPYKNRVFDFSHLDRLNSLLICSDILITDYSSIIYEFALLKKPMIFFSYDLARFEKEGRGFYGKYETIVPGPIAFNTEEIVDIINSRSFDDYNLDGFLSKYLENCDGHSRERLYDLLMK